MHCTRPAADADRMGLCAGDFWLTSRKQAQAKAAGGQHYFCEQCWDRKTGACMPRGKRSSAAKPVQA